MKEGAEVIGVGLGDVQVSERSMGGMIKASGCALTTGLSHLTRVVPVLRRKLPPQQQQAQEGAEAQHQEQSGHQGNPSYRTKTIRRVPWADRDPSPGPAEPRGPKAPRTSAQPQTRAAGAPPLAVPASLPSRSCRPVTCLRGGLHPNWVGPGAPGTLVGGTTEPSA